MIGGQHMRNLLAPPLPGWYTRRMPSASKPMELLLQIGVSYQREWLTPFIAAACFIALRAFGVPLGRLDWFLAFVLLLPVFMATLSVLLTHPEFLIEYHGLRHRWQAMPALLPRYQRSVARSQGDIKGRVAAASWRARMAAHREGIEAGLAQLRPLEDDPEVPEVDVLRIEVIVRMELGYYAEAIALCPGLVELEPDNLMNWLVVAELVALFDDDPEAARRAFDMARSFDTFSMLGPLSWYFEGITLFAERDYAAALEPLSEFRACVPKLRHRLPQILGIGSSAATAQAIAEAGLGNTDAARATLWSMRTSLRRHEASHLLNHCRYMLALRDLEHLLDPPGSRAAVRA